MSNPKKIVLDPGHGGTDRKNVGPTGYVEADGVLEIAYACRDKLHDSGYEVLLTRENDRTVSIDERAKIINHSGAYLALSIHTNAIGDPRIRGIEVIHSVFGNAGKNLAEVLYNRLAQELQLPKRRLFARRGNQGRDYYGIIRKTVMPCVIVEVEFHTNPEAEQLLKDPAFRQKAGIALAKGVMEYCV